MSTWTSRLFLEGVEGFTLVTKNTKVLKSCMEKVSSLWLVWSLGERKQRCCFFLCVVVVLFLGGDFLFGGGGGCVLFVVIRVLDIDRD